MGQNSDTLGWTPSETHQNRCKHRVASKKDTRSRFWPTIYRWYPEGRNDYRDYCGYFMRVATLETSLQGTMIQPAAAPSILSTGPKGKGVKITRCPNDPRVQEKKEKKNEKRYSNNPSEPIKAYPIVTVTKHIILKKHKTNPRRRSRLTIARCSLPVKGRQI